MRRFKSELIPVIFGLVAMVAIILYATTEPENHDPRVGAVLLKGGEVTKQCDGTRLVYSGDRSVAVVPNAPECARG